MAGEIDEHKIVKYKNKIIKTAAKLKRKNEKLAKAKVRVEDSKKTIRSYLISQIIFFISFGGSLFLETNSPLWKIGSVIGCISFFTTLYFMFRNLYQIGFYPLVSILFVGRRAFKMGNILQRITQIHVIRSMVLYTFAYILLMFIFFILFIPFLYLGVYKLTVNRRDKRISEQIERNEKDISILLSAYGMV